MYAFPRPVGLPTIRLVSPSQVRRFTANDDVDPTAVAAHFAGEVLATEPTTLSWWDTFDWRLWREDRVLEASGTPPSIVVVLRGVTDDRPRWTAVAERVPRFAGDDAPGAWSTTVAPLIGERMLLPVASAEVVRTRIVIRDRNDKTTAEVLVDDARPRGPRWIRVVEVRGYASVATDLTERLGALPGVTPTDEHPMAAAISDGRVPGRAGTELDFALDANMPALGAVRRMLRHLHTTMHDIEPWLPGAVDPEFVHDYRVAIRRSRSVLKFSARILPDSDRERWQIELRDLQQRTNTLRDLDVFVLGFDTYRALVPPSYRGDLEPLYVLLAARRAEARQHFTEYITSPRHEVFDTDYEAFLAADDAGTDDNLPANARRPIAETGAARVKQAHRRVVRRLRGISDSSASSELHALRIACKELRYVLELHAEVLPDRPRVALVKRVKQLQTLLGEYQDAEVHIRELERWATMVGSTTIDSTRCVMAMGVLGEHFRLRQDTLRARCAARLARFDTARTRDLVRAVGDTRIKR